MNPDALRADFDRYYLAAQKFAAKLLGGIEAIVASRRLSLAVPLESRVKSLTSILDKLERKPRDIKSVVEIGDFVGVRAILLFRRDADELGAAIESHFTILGSEDTGARLREGEFGYQSRHYLVSLPHDWLTIPSFSPFGDLRAELQVRTVAQHMWAAASHILQYKQKQSVPLPLRRSIYRISALLEIVDLEFGRLLGERRQYVEEVAELSTEQPLDVDVLAKTLDQLLPEASRTDGSEDYSSLLADLITAGVGTTAELAALISRRLPEAMAEDQKVVQVLKSAQRDVFGRLAAQVGNHSYSAEPSRINTGVFSNHTELVHAMLRRETKTA